MILHSDTETGMKPTQRRHGYRALAAAGACLSFLLGAGASAQAAGSLPDAATGPAANVTYSGATLTATINPHGEATEYFFQYGTSRSFGSETPMSAAGSGTATVHVTQAITGLAAFTTYHYRVLATNLKGASVGADRTFTTPKIPLTVAIVGVPNPVEYGRSYTVEGTLSGTGAAGQGIMLEANPFPYLAGFQDFGNAEIANSAGSFSFPVLGASENTQLRVADVATPSVVSSAILEQVAVKVTLHARASTRRGFARLFGTVQPAEVGALVGFQRLQPGHRTKNVGGTVVKAATATSSTFSRVVRVKRGLYEALIKVSDGAHVANTSLPVLIR